MTGTISSIDELLKRVFKYNKNFLDQKRIKEAYDYADKMHGDQMRESGERYITHPLSVAYILAGLHADTDTIIAGLLHDVVEDTSVSLEDIEKLFGKNVAVLVNGVTKIKHIRVDNDLNEVDADNKKLALNIEKIFSSMNEDVRVMIIKLADRLHNMQTLKFKKNAEKRLRKCKETLYFFAPLAHNLGLYEMKSELEDLAFKYMNEKEYKKVLKIIDKKTKEELETINRIKSDLEKKLAKEKILDSGKIEIKIKKPYRIFRKLNKGRELEDITNFFTLNVYVKNKKDCYGALYTIHTNYQYIGRKFKDYVSVKKTNDYSSLHTAIFTNRDSKIQINIQTSKMEITNKFGIAGNWTNNKNHKNIMQKTYENTEFYKSIVKIMNSHSSSSELIDKVNMLFKPGIYIVVDQRFYRVPPFTKVGDLPRLIPSVFDGAKKIKVDGKLVSLNKPLKSRESIKPIFD